MTTEATTFSKRLMERPVAAHKAIAAPGLLWRYRRVIEHSDWDEKFIAQEQLIDKICIGIMIVAALYFITSVLIATLMR
jgi:hypothetical protein